MNNKMLALIMTLGWLLLLIVFIATTYFKAPKPPALSIITYCLGLGLLTGASVRKFADNESK